MNIAVDSVYFLVRERTRWFLAPVPATAPVEVTLEAILGRFFAEHEASQPEDRDHSASLPLDTIVAPVWTWIGRLADGQVLLEDSEGDALPLDLLDLRIIDCLTMPVTVADLSAASGVGDTPERLARLAKSGKVRLGTLPMADQIGEPVVTVQPEKPEVPDLDPAETEVRSRRILPGRFRRRSSRLDASPAPQQSFDHAVTDRIGVHSVWQREIGPVLSLGMLTACAQQWNGGELTTRFDIHPPQDEEQFFVDLAQGSGPAVLLCSNYVWSLEYNLSIARRAKQARPELLIVHGGPSTPKYPGDAELFLRQHGDIADILVRGEGEVTLCKLLAELGASLPDLDVDRLSAIPGLTFIDPASESTIRTPEPERIADLDSLPSPYLTGVFDHIEGDAWPYSLPIETNRGCPYGCTFCDWGSATLSRIRMFDIDRVLAEFRWAAERQLLGIQLCDANFGITGRDVTIAQGLAEIRREHRAPTVLSFTPAKNTTKHITKILDSIIDAGFLISTAISLQTTDEATLKAVKRSNISTDNYLAFAADLRRRALPLQGDLLIGLPGQTYDSYKADIQFFVEHEIAPRSWSVRALPNAPMNDPEYRERYAIESDEQSMVTATSTLDAAQRERMLALRKVQVIADQFGLFAQLMRLLQWDYHIPLTDFLDRLIDLTTQEPTRYPLITWVIEYFDLYPTCPVGWVAFYTEVADLLESDFGLDSNSPDIACTLSVQRALMPSPGRNFSATVKLPHDFVSYYRSATDSLYTSGHASVPAQPLRNFPPSDFTVAGDPLGLCTHGLQLHGDSRDESMLGQFWVGIGGTYELESPLRRVAPEFRDVDLASSVLDSPPTHTGQAEPAARDGHPLTATPVSLMETSRRDNSET